MTGADSAATAEGFATALDDLVRILTEHTALEEKAVLPLAEKYITAAEWEQMGQHGMDTFQKRLLPLAFGMLSMRVILQ